MKKFKNSFDYDHTSVKNEVIKGKSMTQPNMTMSLKELLERYVRGGEVATFTPSYQEGDDFEEYPDISKMDKIERLEYLEEVRDAVAYYQDKLSKKTEALNALKERERSESTDEGGRKAGEAARPQKRAGQSPEQKAEKDSSQDDAP